MENLFKELGWEEGFVLEEKPEQTQEDGVETQVEDTQIDNATQGTESDDFFDFDTKVVQEEETKQEGVTPEQVMYQFLLEKNLSSPKEDFKDEDLYELLEDLPRNMLVQEISKLPKKGQEFLTYAYNLGENLTEDKIEEFFNLSKEVSVDDPEQVIRQHLKDTKELRVIYNTDDKIDNYLDSLISDGNLEETAESILAEKNRQKEQEKEAKLKESEQFRKENEERQKNFVQNINKTLEELPWNPVRKTQVLQNLNPENVQRKNMLIQGSPKALVQLADIYSYFDEEKKEFDFSGLIDAKAESIKTEGFRKLLEKDSFISSTAKTKNQNSNIKKQDDFKIIG